MTGVASRGSVVIDRDFRVLCARAILSYNRNSCALKRPVCSRFGWVQRPRTRYSMPVEGRGIWHKAEVLVQQTVPRLSRSREATHDRAHTCDTGLVTNHRHQTALYLGMACLLGTIAGGVIDHRSRTALDFWYKRNAPDRRRSLTHEAYNPF